MCIEDAVIPRKAQVRTLQLLWLGVKMSQRHCSEASDTVQKWDDGKSVLKNHLHNKYPSCSSSRSVVIHGGALLHKVKWFYGSSFADIIDPYIQNIQNRFSKYKSVTIIFDGYNQQMSITSSEHKIRTSQVTAADVFLTTYDSYHNLPSISFQHKKQGWTHQSLAFTTDTVGLFNLPEWGRRWHLYCG